MLDTTAALLTYQAANWFATGKIPQRQGNRHATIAPYETFTTRDGEIVIAVGNDEIWKRFCAADRTRRSSPPIRASRPTRIGWRTTTRCVRRSIARSAPKTSAEWIAILNDAGVANGEVRDIGQMLNDPQLAAREMVQTLMHPTVGATRVIGAPIKLSENAGERAHAAAGAWDSTPTRCWRDWLRRGSDRRARQNVSIESKVRI